MENQTQLQSNYFTLKNENQCKCPQTVKCTVDVNRISAVLDSYYIRLQNLSKEQNKHKTQDDLSLAFSKGAVTNQWNPFHSSNNLRSTPDTNVLQFGFQQVISNELEMQQKLLNAGAGEENSAESILRTPQRGNSLERSKLPSQPMAADLAARPFRCAECGMAFKRNLHLKRHFTVTHTSKKNFSCSNCDKSFSRKDYLDKHVATHEKRKFKLKLLQQGIVVRTKMNVKSTKQNLVR